MSGLTDKGFVIWFTGLPASGKTTLARAVQVALRERDVPTLLLDSDELRQILTPEPAYTAAERDWFYRVLGEWALWLAREGQNVLIAATANKQRYRTAVREQHGRFAEVYVACDLATCQARDPKGIYARAAAAAEDSVPGVGAGYEPPDAPEAVIDTAVLSPEEGAKQLLSKLHISLILGNG